MRVILRQILAVSFASIGLLFFVACDSPLDSKNSTSSSSGLPSQGSQDSNSLAIVSEDFGNINNVDDLQSADWFTPTDYTWNTFGLSSTGFSSRISIDATDGAPGGSSKSLLYSFPVGTGGVGVGVRIPGVRPEVWTEVWAKFSANFDSGGSCNGGNPDYKFIFWGLQPNNARNEIKVGNFGNMRFLDTRYNAGPDTLRITTANPINSGQWHRYRIHNKVAASNQSIFSVEFWDGVNAPQLLQQSNFTLNYTAIDPIILGANRNCVSTVNQWLKIGKISVFSSDPGWGY